MPTASAVGTSAREAMRREAVSTKARNSPDRMALEVVVGSSHSTSTWPLLMSSMAGAAPLYCTIVTDVPIASWKSMAQRWVALPMHDEAKVTFSLLALA